jgi:hypothetical protein
MLFFCRYNVTGTKSLLDRNTKRKRCCINAEPFENIIQNNLLTLFHLHLKNKMKTLNLQMVENFVFIPSRQHEEGSFSGVGS